MDHFLLVPSSTLSRVSCVSIQVTNRSGLGQTSTTVRDRGTHTRPLVGSRRSPLSTVPQVPGRLRPPEPSLPSNSGPALTFHRCPVARPGHRPVRGDLQEWVVTGSGRPPEDGGVTGNHVR